MSLFNVKISRKQRRKILVLGGVALAVFVLVIIGIFFLGVKIKFFLSDELHLDLSPLVSSVRSVNGEEVVLNFSLRNDNFPQCSTSCEFTFEDVGRDIVLSRERLVMQHHDVALRNFTVRAPMTGEGQTIYRFEAACRNQRTLLCQSDERDRHVSSLVWMNYRLSDNHALWRDESKPLLASLFLLYNQVSPLVHQLGALVDRVPSGITEYAQLSSSNALLTQEFLMLSSRVLTYQAWWDAYQFGALHDARVADDIAALSGVAERAGPLFNRSLELIALRNHNLDLLRDFQANTSLILQAATFYHQQSSPHNRDALHSLYLDVDGLHGSYVVVSQNLPYVEESLASIIQRHHVSLGATLEEYLRISINGEFLRRYSYHLLNDSALLAGDVCDAARLADSLIVDRNAAAIANRTAANISADPAVVDTDLAFHRLAMERAALLAVRNDSQVLGSLHRDLILGYVDAMLGLGPDPSAHQFTLDAANRSLFATLDASPFVAYSSVYCADGGPAMGWEYANITSRFPLGRLPVNISTDVSGVDGDDAVDQDIVLSDHQPQCCVFGVCSVCCDACAQSPVPILFIHGHGFNEDSTPEFTLGALTKIQRKLESEGILNAGQLDVGIPLSSIERGEWGRSSVPVSVRASYYYITAFNLGSYVVYAQKSERIENYAIRLKEVVDLLKYKTGSDSVIIVAHSMGGLVAREYISLFGDDAVHALITVNTPHQGIPLRTAQLCKLFGSARECEDMLETSVFMNRLSAQPVPQRMHVIRSVGCPMEGNATGDGVVTDERGYLAGAQNYVINGSCTDRFQTSLHGEVLDPDVYPELYALLVQIIKEE